MIEFTWHGSPLGGVTALPGRAMLSELLASSADGMSVSIEEGPFTVLHPRHGVAYIEAAAPCIDLADHLAPGRLLGRVRHQDRDWTVSLAPAAGSKRVIAFRHALQTCCGPNGFFLFSGLPDEFLDISVWRRIPRPDGLQLDLLRADLPVRLRIGERSTWIDLAPVEVEARILTRSL